MGEAKREREAVIREFGDSELWKVTDGAERVMRRERLKELHLQGVIARLAKCPVCGEAAKLVVFGRDGRGVWVGCDRSPECARYIEHHVEGWSIDDATACWNHRNRGLNWVIRKLKMWFRRVFDKNERAEREKKREAAKKRELEKAERMKRFGVEIKRSGFFGRMKKRAERVLRKFKKEKRRW